MMVGIVNYGMGNLGSIQNMLKKIGVPSLILNDALELDKVTKLILPGVGAFDNGILELRKSKWIETLNHLVLQEKMPILGICLGMQLMTNKSEEGNEAGLGWINAETVKFRFEDNQLKIPHMGWNIVTPTTESSLFNLAYEELRFYHVHSYYVKLKDPTDEIAVTNYGTPFTCAFRKENIWGVQFHPEKSHKFGMEMFRNFSNI